VTYKFIENADLSQTGTAESKGKKP